MCVGGATTVLPDKSADGSEEAEVNDSTDSDHHGRFFTTPQVRAHRVATPARVAESDDDDETVLPEDKSADESEDKSDSDDETVLPD